MDRRTARVGLTVAHEHRAGNNAPVRMVSELAFLRGAPKAILEWIDIGGQRTPICVDLDPDKLVASGGKVRGRFCYGETTVDPRTVDVASNDP